jgi:nitroreductase
MSSQLHPVALPLPARTADHDVLRLFTDRWSGRALSGAAVAPEELARLFEAARWAPSGGNGQPWRFVHARRGSPAFARILESLMPQNRVWAERAGALVAVVSAVHLPDGRPRPAHAFDAGAAWMSLALQGASMGLVVHAMGGFDRAAAAAAIELPEGWDLHVIVAVGRPGDVRDLPPALQAREAPSARKPVAEIAFADRFPA